MIETLKKRVAKEESGFTLIELLVVIIILGILLAIAVPSYLGLKDRADKSAAQSNVRAVVPDIEQYKADNVPSGADDPDASVSTTDSGYENINATLLQTYDASINPSKIHFVGSTSTPTNYCVYSQSGNWVAYKHGPSAEIGVEALPSGGFTACP